MKKRKKTQPKTSDGRTPLLMVRIDQTLRNRIQKACDRRGVNLSTQTRSLLSEWADEVLTK